MKFFGTVKATYLESSSSFASQQSDHYDITSEAFDSSPGSRSSQSTPSYSVIQGHAAPVAPMAPYSDILGPTPPTVTFNIPDTSFLPLSRPVPQLKRSHGHTLGKKHKGNRLSGKYDPENHEIMRLRQEENLDFKEIADRLNETRYKNGGKADFTDNAIYSRYTRNAPLIAQMKNEKFVPTAKVRFIGLDSEQDKEISPQTQCVGQSVHKNEISKSGTIYRF